MVGIQKNSRKTARMLFRPFHVVGTQLKVTNKCKTTGEGLTYWAGKKLGVH